MLRLFLIVFTMAAPTLAGILVVFALVVGLDTTTPIIVAAVLGALAAVPVARIIARKIQGLV